MLGKYFLRFTSFDDFSFGARKLFVLGFAFALISLFVFNSSAYASTYSLGLTTSGTVSVDVSVSGNGASVTEDDLVVTSTCPLGYTITIQGPTDTTLYKDGNSANNTTTTKISPSTGTISSPASILGNNQGTWGYTLGNDITTSSNFIGLTNAATTLITKAQQSGDGTVLTDTIPVYYGVSVQPNQAPGLYKMSGDQSITYFITTPQGCTSYNIEFDANGGTGAMNAQIIPEGVATPLTTNGFTAPTGYSFNGWNTKADGTGSSYVDQQSVTDISAVNTTITLYAQWQANTYTVTLDKNGATNTPTGSTTATYDSTTLASIATLPQKVYTITGLANNGSGGADATVTFNTASGSVCTGASNCKYTYAFNGWYTATSGGSKVASNAAVPALQASVPEFTDSSSKWVATEAKTLHAQWGSGTTITLPTITKTGHTCGWATANNTTTVTYTSGQTGVTLTANIQLYGTCTPDTYTITLNKNNGTGGSNTATATYGSTTLSTITNPSRANSTGTRTVSGFTKGTNAADATITWATSGGCTSSSNCKSTNTTTYTFAGWYKEAAATNKIASNATTPVLQASTSYTDANGKWTSTSNQTLYAGWTASAGSYSTVKLPKIELAGYNCGWSSSSATATTYNYNSEATITPSGNLTLYGICVANQYTINLNQNNATTNGTTSVKATYNSSSLSSSITKPSRAYTISFVANNSGCSVGNASKTYTYTFGGWYTTSAATGGTQIINASGALTASNGFTNASSQWTSTSGTTVYARWTNQSFTMPSSTKTGHTCAWNTKSDGTGTSYTQNTATTAFAPTGATTLNAIATPNKYTITFNGDAGVSNFTVDGSTVSKGGTKSLTYGQSYTVTINYVSGFTAGSTPLQKNSGSGTVSGTSFTVGAGVATLYANSAVIMQNISSSNCTTTARQAYDNRDGSYYMIQKLSDNKCWMLDNLALDLTAVSLTKLRGNTNASNATLGYLKNGGGTVNDKYAVTGVTSSWDPGSYKDPLIDIASKDTVGNTSDQWGVGSHKYGVYYNYCAASAGSYCYDNLNLGPSGDATEDICPVGWSMPSRNNFQSLCNAVLGSTCAAEQAMTASSSTSLQYKLSTPLSGDYYAGAARNQGSFGRFWSSSLEVTTSMYGFFAKSDTVELEHDVLRIRGESIRCILK